MRHYGFVFFALSCAFIHSIAPNLYGLGMQECINKALDYSARIQSQREYYSSATYQRYASFSAFMPTLQTSYIYSYNAPTANIAYSLNTFNLTGRINLFRGLRDYLNTKESAQNLTRKSLDLKNTIADITLNTKLAYIKILQSKALLQTAIESKNLLSEQLKKANLFYQQGLRAKNEVLTMELQLSNALITYENAKLNLQYATHQLSNLVGAPINPDEIEEISHIDLINYQEHELLSLALNNNPSYLFIKSQLESAKIARKSAMGAFLPQLDINGIKYWYIDGAGATRYTYGLQSQIGINVSLNLFNGLSDGLNYQIKHYDFLAIQNTLLQYSRDIEINLQSLLKDYESAKKQLNISEDSLKKAKENYTIINNRYLQNLSTYTELINAQLLLTNVQTNINQARYNILSIQANIQRITNP